MLLWIWPNLFNGWPKACERNEADRSERGRVGGERGASGEGRGSGGWRCGDGACLGGRSTHSVWSAFGVERIRCAGALVGPSDPGCRNS